MNTSECPEHHEDHQFCTTDCRCCHGTPNRRKTWFFVFALLVIAVVAATIIKEKKNKTQDQISFNERPCLALFGDSRCEKCAPMFDLFQAVEITDSGHLDFKVYDRKEGAFPYAITIEPTIILFDKEGKQLDSAFGVISAEKIRAMKVQ